MSDDTNHRVTELTELTNPEPEDLFHAIDDVAGVATSKKSGCR